MNAFASSAKTHYIELSIRLIVGSAFILYSPSMLFGHYFELFGWIVLITTLALFMIPWQWHQRFAALVIPTVVCHLRGYGLLVILAAIFILYAILKH